MAARRAERVARPPQSRGQPSTGERLAAEGRVPPEWVAAAERALASGAITREQLVLLLKDAVDHAWDFIAGIGIRSGRARP